MRFGLVVIDDASEPHVVGVLSSAMRRRWTCRCFLTDRGVRLLMSPRFQNWLQANPIKVDVCELSWSKFGSGTHPENVVMGGQYQNAELVRTCDKVLVL
jgi:hypothetical protein